MRVKTLIWCLLILFSLSNCWAESSKESEIIDLRLMSEDNSLLPANIVNNDIQTIFYNKYFNFYKSHNIYSVDFNDNKFMSYLSTSFYYAQFANIPVLSGLQNIRQDPILAHYKKTDIFPLGVSADCTILDIKGNTCVITCIQPKDQKKERKVLISEDKKQIIYDGIYAFYADDENLVKKFDPKLNLDAKEKDNYIKCINKLNGYSHIINNDSLYKKFYDETLPKYQSYTLCIGKDEKGYFMGFALYYYTEQDATKDIQIIDNIIREKPLFTYPGSRLSDFFIIEKDFISKDKNVLYGKIYQIDNNMGHSIWKNTLLKRDYLF